MLNCNFVFELSTEMRERFDDFINQQVSGTFMQSPEWTKLVPLSKIQRYGYIWCEDGEELLMVGIVRLTQLFFNRYIGVFQRGPVFKGIKNIEVIMPKIKKYLKDIGVFTVIMNPYWKEDSADQVSVILKKSGFKELPRNERTLNSTTAIVDLVPNKEEIFAGFKTRCRRNIRKAERHGVIIRVADNERDANMFQDIHDSMAKEKGMDISGFPNIVKLWQTIQKNNNGLFLVAELDNKIIGGIISIREGKRAYLQVIASSSQLPKIPQTSILYWECMQMMKDSGCEEFDMVGFPDGGIENAISKQEKNRAYYKLEFNPNVVRLVPSHAARLLPLSHFIFFKARQKYLHSSLRPYIRSIIS